MIESRKAEFPVALMCRCLRVSRSGYYARRQRPVSTRAKADEELALQIQQSHRESRATYGSPRIHAELRSRGVEAGRHRVARLMRELDLRGRARRRFRRTTDSSHSQPVAKNLLNREFAVSGPNQAWVGDITYLRTQQGWLYLAVLLDLFSRRVVGWSLRPRLDTELALGALRMAVGQRALSGRLIHHTDRGVQYASNEYQEALRQAGMLCSMSRKGNCLDNAVAESFFSTLKTELAHRSHWHSHEEARCDVFEYIAGFYNQKRLHSTLGYRSPGDVERCWVERRFPAEADAATGLAARPPESLGKRSAFPTATSGPSATVAIETAGATTT